MRTYTLRKLKLGDTWAAVSWLLQQREAVLSEKTRSRGPSRSVRSLITEIADLLATEERISFAAGNDGEPLPEMECYQHEYLPTKRCWTGGAGRVVCLQLDGRWQSRRKNPKPEETARLIARLEAAGFVVQRLGQPMRLAECAEALATCYCFIGVDSGMMHVAHSVRCPRILIRNRMYKIDTVYRGKGLMLTANADTAARLLVV
jgi:hypothetical protein